MKDFLRVFGIGLVLVIAGFVAAFQFIKPSPPKNITIATGSPSGAYYAYAKKYQELLAEEGINLTIVNTAGSVDNIQRVMAGEVDIAFVQSGTSEVFSNTSDPASPLTSENVSLVSLASLYYEPLWLFMPSEQSVFSTKELMGKRIAIGAEGSGTRSLSQLVLANNGIDDTNAILSDLPSDQAAEELLAGNLDYVFLVSSVEAPLVQSLLNDSSVVAFDFERAKAYTRRYRFLSATELPQGVINFQKNIPAADVNLLSAAATMVAQDNIHPALVALLMQVFEKVHAQGGILEDPSQFPSRYYVDFPLDSSAKRFFDYGPPLLQRYLPFWAAVLVNQLKVLLIPLIALMIPLFRILPILYRWRIRSRIYCWYEQLRDIEQELEKSHSLTQEARNSLLTRLQAMHHKLMKESIPLAYHDELYHLRVHVELVRESLHNAKVISEE